MILLAPNLDKLGLSAENRAIEGRAPPAGRGGERYGLRPRGSLKKADATRKALKEFKRLDSKSGVRFPLKHRFSGDLFDG